MYFLTNGSEAREPTLSLRQPEESRDSSGLGWFLMDITSLGYKDPPIKTLEDMKGERFDPPLPTPSREPSKLWGANATPIPWPGNIHGHSGQAQKKLQGLAEVGSREDCRKNLPARLEPGRFGARREAAAKAQRHYWLRMGDWRVIFDQQDAVKIIRD